MKKPMTIENALELILQACDMTVAALENDGHVTGGALLSRAANILRNMAEEPVVKSEIEVCGKCRDCGALYNTGQCPNCETCLYGVPYRARKIWTETRVLKIVNQKTDVKFKGVEK